MNNVNTLIDSYYSWLKDKTAIRQLKDYVEIKTPYLDRHNDYIMLYLKHENGHYVLTDDGYTIEDLIQSGCSIDSPKRQKILKITINGFGVQLDKDSLIVKATADNFSYKKHSLIQAILAVNDMFYLASSTVSSLFFEDVKNWLDLSEIRYTERVTFVGKSGYSRLFDFVVPKSKKAPERIIKTINNPKKSSADSIVLDWLDTRETRANNSKAYAFINDYDREVSNSVIDALTSYDINPVLWTKKENAKQELAA